MTVARMLALVALLALPGVASAGPLLVAYRALVPGEINPLTVPGVPPGLQVHFVVSANRTAPYQCPAPLAPTCLDLGAGAARYLGSAVADASGRATLAWRPPGPLAATGLWLQAWYVSAPGGGQITSPVRATIHAATSDADGDGLDAAAELALGTDPGAADTDGDGLIDREEVFDHATDPLEADTDGDLLSDGDEVGLHGSSPVLADTDGDGLTDGEEVLTHATDPLDADTDGDTLADGDEVQTHGTDPTLADTDGGSVDDAAELAAGTDPNVGADDVIDTDADGLSDSDEAAYGTGALVPDTDGDGLLDGDEVHLHGTDPTIVDTDGGGVGDGDEVDRGFDPLDPGDELFQADSDLDGLSDGDEALVGTDDAVPDTDGDGLLDGPEVVVLGSDPLSTDSDGGGMPDGEEAAWELDPTDPSDDTGTQGLPIFFDDFERGLIDRDLWYSHNGSVSYSTTHAGAGVYGLRLTAGAVATTETVDTSPCSSLLVTTDFQGSDPSLMVRWDSGVRMVDFWVPEYRSPFGYQEALLTDPNAMHADFALELAFTAASSSSYVDNLRIICSPGMDDSDADEVLDWLDCDDADPAHWEDCGRCVDVDLDGRGSGCDLGADCDDHDATVHPRATDPSGDGEDQDCSGEDGPRLFDDFELGVPDPSVWAVDENTDAQVSAGNDYRRLTVNDVLETWPVDLSSCPSVWLEYDRQPLSASSNYFDVAWWNGERWATARTHSSGSVAWSTVSTNLPADAAERAELAVRFTSEEGSSYLDDVSLRCGGADADADGHDLYHDCDDADPDRWAACAACVDADGDGYGSGCDRGTDCHDGDAAVHPGAADAYGDGLDTDCSARDGAGVSDSIGTTLDRSKWAEQLGQVQPKYSVAFPDGYALLLGSFSSLTSHPMDTTGCATVTYAFDLSPLTWTHSGHELVLEYFDGSDWRVATRELGLTETVGTDILFPSPQWTSHSGAIRDPAARSDRFQVRFRTAADSYYLDDIYVGCGGDDADGDGVDDELDCDDADDWTWASCGLCGDLDGDGHGAGCDLGSDCDETDPGRFFGASDLEGDGYDADCDGTDRAGWFDDFESGGTAPDPDRWRDYVQTTEIVLVDDVVGDHALEFRGNVDTERVDLSACDAVAWHADLRAEGVVLLSFWDGDAYVPVDTFRDLDDFGEPVRVGGVISDPAALGASVGLRWEVGPFEQYLVYSTAWLDDLGFGCATVDADGDGMPVEVDCDDASPDLWFRCDTCVDADGDGYGRLCDRAEDCHDGDATIFPESGADSVGDGVDQDCDGADGEPFLVDSFESGGAHPTDWETLIVAEVFAGDDLEGDHHLKLGRSYPDAIDASIESAAFDASACDDVGYRFLSRADENYPADVVLAYTSDSGSDTDVVTVPGTDDSVRVESVGTLGASAASTGLRVELRREGSRQSMARLDDVVIGCSAPDADGDGFPSAFDCDDADGDRWTSCGRCVDADADGHGPYCDLGRDCDDTDAGRYGGAPDSVGDGVDQDCSGHDGPGLLDSFELGRPDPEVWDVATFPGDSVVVPAFATDGDYSLHVAEQGSVETRVVDTTGCATLSFVLEARAGAASSTRPSVQYWASGVWRTALDLEDVGFRRRAAAEITDPAAFSSGFKLRVAAGTSAGGVHLDELFVGCGGSDGDLDGWPVPADCDDTDPDRWLRCDLCLDADGDGRGDRCDQLRDCDELDPLVYVGAPDAVGDGLDQDCSGADGVDFFEDFEGGDERWVSSEGWSSAFVHAGSGSARMTYLSELDSVPIDMSDCREIDWSFRAKRGPAYYDPYEELYLKWGYENAFGDEVWTTLSTVVGGATDASFVLRSGTIADPAARVSDFRIRLTTAFESGEEEEVYVDDVAFTCIPW